MATSTLSTTGRTPVEGVGHRTTARVVGVLFIVATATAIIGGGLVMQSLDAPDYLVQAAAHEGQVVAGVVLEFILALSVIGIAALLLPVLRPHGEGMAVGYVAVRTLEAAFILMATTTALLVLALGQDSGSAISAGVEPVGGALLSAREWTYFVGTMPLFGVSAVILNALALPVPAGPGLVVAVGPGRRPAPPDLCRRRTPRRRVSDPAATAGSPDRAAGDGPGRVVDRQGLHPPGTTTTRTGGRRASGGLT